MKRVHILVQGRVQGISFRAFVKREADTSGLTGFVKNLDSGSVEIVAEGSENELKKFVEILKTKHPIARVEMIDVKWSNANKEFSGFAIKR